MVVRRAAVEKVRLDAGKHLRRHVALRPADGLLVELREDDVLDLGAGAEAKVANHGHVLLRQEEVVQLQVAVDDVLRVEVVQTAQQPTEALLRLAVGVGALQLLEELRLDGAILAQLHEDVPVVGGFEHLQRQHDVLVFDVLGDVHLILQAPLHPHAVVVVVQVEDLHRQVHRLCLRVVGAAAAAVTAWHLRLYSVDPAGEKKEEDD